MPTLPTRFQQPKPVNPQVPIPNEFPAIPQSIIDRFPDAVDWQKRLNDFWTRSNQAIQEAQQQVSNQANSTVIFSVDKFLIYQGNNPTPMFALDDTGIRLGNVLVVNTIGKKLYIGAGEFANDSTPFYIDTLGFFSLGASLTWDPDTDTLTITGVINATSGTIGGFVIGATTLTGANITLTANDYNTAIAISRPANYSSTLAAWGIQMVDGIGNNAASLRVDGGWGVLQLNSNNSQILLGDTNLYRSAANTLKTDDSFAVAVNLTVNGTQTLDGLLTFNKTDVFMLATGATTGASFGQIENTGGLLYFGVDNASGNALATVSAYDSVLAFSDATGLAIIALGTAMVARFSVSGLNSCAIGASIASTGTFTALTATGLTPLFGPGTSSFILSLNGGNSGAADGASVYIKNAGTTVVALGNKSQILGGAYNADGILYNLNGFEITTGGTTARISVASAGAVTISNLAGAGTRNVVADANGVLSAP